MALPKKIHEKFPLPFFTFSPIPLSLPPLQRSIVFGIILERAYAQATSHFSSAVEQLIRNQQVEGSNPLSGSKKK